MAGVITQSAHPKLLWPGIEGIWGQVYPEWVRQWEALVDVGTSDKAYEETLQMIDFGLAPVKPEGQPIQYDTEIQGYTTRWTNVVYGLGYIVTWEEILNNLYPQVSQDRVRSLAFSMNQTKETVVAGLYNNGFTGGAYAGSDGVSLFNTAHPNVTGGTFSNQLATGADLSEAAIEDLCIQIMNATNDRGLRISLQPQSIIVPNSYQFDLQRILKSQFQTNTANNNVNVIATTNTFPKGGHVNNFLTSTTAWFIRTSAPHQPRLLQRYPATFDQDNDFDTMNARAKAVEYYSVNVDEPRSIFASAG